jgi:hypothetical protein
MIRPAPALPAGSSADRRGAFRPTIAVADDRLALPHDLGRTLSGAPAARSCGNLPVQRGGTQPGDRGTEAAVGLARLRSRRPVEAADVTDDDIPGHGESQVLRRPNATSQAGCRESKLIAAHHCKADGCSRLAPADRRLPGYRPGPAGQPVLGLVRPLHKVAGSLVRRRFPMRLSAWILGRVPAAWTPLGGCG